MRARYLFVAFMLFAMHRFADAETTALVGGRILTMAAAGQIDNGTVLIRDDVIVAVGASVRVPPDARVIDVTGRTVTPGFLAAGAQLGTTEIPTVSATQDFAQRSGKLSAAFDVSLALNPSSTLIPVARLGGITRAIVTPRYLEASDDRVAAGQASASYSDTGLFAGQAAFVHLGAGSEMVVRSRVAMVLAIDGEASERAGGARAALLRQLSDTLDEVRRYSQQRSRRDSKDAGEARLSRADLEALVAVVQGKQLVVVEANSAEDIRAALRLAREHKLKIALSGAAEGWTVAAEIAAAGVPVLLDSFENLPTTFESLRATQANAARLHAAGVTIAIVGDGGPRIRELRYRAGNAVAHGLPYEQALAAITINPARIFGVDDLYGSLQPGKQADAVVWNGDPLEPLSQPEHIFVRGQEQSLTTRQLQLRDRYRQLGGEYPPAYRTN